MFWKFSFCTAWFSLLWKHSYGFLHAPVWKHWHWFPNARSDRWWPLPRLFCIRVTNPWFVCTFRVTNPWFVCSEANKPGIFASLISDSIGVIAMSSRELYVEAEHAQLPWKNSEFFSSWDRFGLRTCRGSSANRPIPLAVDRAGNPRVREQEVRMSWEKDDREATEIASHDAFECTHTKIWLRMRSRFEPRIRETCACPQRSLVQCTGYMDCHLLSLTLLTS